MQDELDDEQLWRFYNELTAEDDLAEDPSGSGGGAPAGPGTTGEMELRGASSLMVAFDHLTMAQLKVVLARYVPGSRARNRATALADIDKVTSTPELLDGLIARLDPFERTLLEELQRRGGVASGWELYTFAVLRGRLPAPDAADVTAAMRLPSRSGAADYITRRIFEGILLSKTVVDTWSPYGREVGGADLVSADARLLMRLGGAPVEPIVPLRSTPVAEVALTAHQPAAVVLESLDVLRLVADEGGLAVTRGGHIAKPFLNRLLKKRPHLGKRLEALLWMLAALGFLRPPTDDTVPQPWPVDPEAVDSYHRLPLYMMYAAIIDGYAVVRDPRIDQAWSWSPSGNTRADVFWNSVLQSVPAIPEQPVLATEAVDALWDDVLAHVFDSQGPGWRATPSRPTDALTPLLTGFMPAVGLLATGTTRSSAGEETTVIAAADGARWYARARAVVEGHLGRDPALWTDADERTPDQPPALLVQPNFEVLAYLDRLTSGAVRALGCATAERIDDHTATFKIDRTSVTRALDLDGDLDVVLARLSDHAQALPANVETAMRDWAARRERLRVLVGVRVIEYQSETEREAALPSLHGARALAERFVILDEAAAVPGVAAVHDYSEAPDRTLTLKSDGTVRIDGPLDLPARAALQRVAGPTANDSYKVDANAIRAGALTPLLREELEARATAGVPPQLNVLLRAWSGESSTPVVTPATLFHHTDAADWAKIPAIAKLLSAQVSPSTYLVKPGQDTALERELESLGVEFARSWSEDHSDSDNTAESGMQAGLSTRKKRELIENAIAAGHHLELRYATELERYDRYGSVRSSKGKVKTEEVDPEAIEYIGSLPYLLAVTLSRGTDRLIRVGYIEAIGVRSGG